MEDAETKGVGPLRTQLPGTHVPTPSGAMGALHA